MLILRLFVVLLALLLVSSGGMYIFTRNRRYLEFAWQSLRFALLFVPKRYVLAGWRVLL
ncbi:MAG: hypothetical protein WBQ69_12610 [Gallionella sp.]